MQNKKISDNKYTIVFFVFVVLGAILFIYRAPFSTGGRDEPFFLSVAHRLTKGDALLAEEWHVSQLFSFVLYPIMKVYLLLTGTTEGIVLVFRYIYVAFHIAGTVCVYKCLSKWNLGGLLASLYYLFYLPNNVMNFSYNTIGLVCTLLSLLLIAVPEKEKAWKYILSGILFALGVLACPYNVLMYVAYAVMVFVVTLLKKKGNKDIALRGADMKSLGYVTMGAFLVAVLFAVFVLNRATVREILDNLPYILSDSQHDTNIFTKILWYPASLWITYGYMCLVWFLLVVTIIFDKKRQKRGLIYFIIAAVTVFIELILKIQIHPDGHNAMMFPVVIWGFVAYMLLKDKNRTIFVYIYVGGLLFSLCKVLASSMNMEAIAVGGVVSGIASILFIIKYIQENECARYIKQGVIGMTAIVLSFQIVGEGCALFTNFIDAGSLSDLRITLSEGPLKGIKVSEESAYTENVSLQDIYFSKDKEPGKILFATKRTWYYFWTDMEYAAPSCWINDLDSNYVEILNDYYRLHPDKLPDYIYIAAGEGWDYTDIEEQAGGKNYKVIRTGRGCFLERVK